VSIGNPKPWNPGPAGHQEPAESGIGQSQFRTRQASRSSRRGGRFLDSSTPKGGQATRLEGRQNSFLAGDDHGDRRLAQGAGTGAIRGEANDVTGELLPSLTAEDLRGIGVISAGHRRRALDVIAAMAGPTPPSSPRVRSRMVVGSGGVRGPGWFTEDPHRSDRRAARGAAREDRGGRRRRE
jgi:SAM domain (Sterile alpha motif)